MKAEVTKTGAIDMQVCVPTDWTDEQAKAFADAQNPSGVTHGWCIRRHGDRLLNGDAERVACADRSGFVHIMLDA